MTRADADLRADLQRLADRVGARTRRRLLPITSLPFWDVAAAVKGARRCAAKGHKGILFTGEPQYWEQPLLGDAHWNPLWEVAVRVRPADQLPHRLGQHGDGIIAEEDRGLRQDGGVYRAVGGYLPAQRHPAE